MKVSVALLFFFGVLGSLTISRRPNSVTNSEVWQRPTIEFPADNPWSDASGELGSSLFFEVLMSKDTSISCQSCHLITEGFADHLALGEGVFGRKVTRNTPTIMNIGFHPYIMRDGKFATLEDQVLGPIKDHREFDMTPEEVVKRLKTVSYYNELSQKAYGEELSIEIVKKSLANFQRMMISDNARFDHYMRGDREALSSSEKRGWKLFQSDELSCIECHGGYDFTNYSFQNNGLFKVYEDSGRALITHMPQDIGRFKVPTLRNIEITYPYMADGSIKTLEEVVEHYASGGKKHKNQSKLLRGFDLTASEKTDLINFLKSLTDERFLKEEED